MAYFQLFEQFIFESELEDNKKELEKTDADIKSSQEAVDKAQAAVDKEKAEKLVQKIKKGKGFDLEDFKEQLVEMQKMGGIGSMMDKMPGMNAMPAEVKEKMNDKLLARQIGVINSMTMKERQFPDLIKGNRKKRIADGCGQELSDVNRMLKQFLMMQKMMKKLKSGNMTNMVRGMKSQMRGLRR